MPLIHEYHCDTCEFSMPTGWGSYMYVRAKICAECGERVNEIEDFCVGCGTPTESVDVAGYERVTCSHPTEELMVRRVIGEDYSDEKRDERVGYISHCVCRDCVSKFNVDIERDGRQCPDCGSSRVRTLVELVDEECPNCSEGTFIEGENRGRA